MKLTVSQTSARPDFEGYCVDNAMEKVKSEVGRSVDSPLELLRRFL